MDKVNAFMECYDRSYRITPERPLRRKGGKREFTRVKAEIYHWQESDAMDIFLLPTDKNLSKCTTELIKRYQPAGSITRSTKGRYSLRFDFNGDDLDEMRNTLPDILLQMMEYVREDKGHL